MFAYYTHTGVTFVIVGIGTVYPKSRCVSVVREDGRESIIDESAIMLSE